MQIFLDQEFWVARILKVSLFPLTFIYIFFIATCTVQYYFCITTTNHKMCFQMIYRMMLQFN